MSSQTSSFARRRAYDEQMNAQRSQNRGTTSQFGRVGRNVDKEGQKERLAQHKFVEQAKTTDDLAADDSRQLREELKDVEKDEEKDIVDKSDFKRQNAPPTVRQAPVATHAPDVEKHQLGGAFAKAWTIVDHVLVPPVVKPKKSKHLPNFIAAQMIIHSMENLLNDNEELKWICPNYFSLPVRVYYAVLFYIQILKAKEISQELGKVEGSWFRAFLRAHKLESLPVAGPLVPYFTNITAVKPNDDKYDYVYPEYVKDMGLTVEKGVPTTADSYFIQPNVMIIAEFLRLFTTLTQTTLVQQTVPGTYDHFDQNEAFVPHVTGQAFRYAGIDFAVVPTVAQSVVLTNLGLDAALPETMDQLKRILPYWRRSKAADIPPADTTDNYDNIGKSMRMMDSFGWFESCVQMAAVQCKFFTDSINMSQIPATGGSEVLLSARITGKRYRAPTSWYPMFWQDLKARFDTTRADTEQEQVSNSAYALTTGTISWTTGGHPVGGRQIGHRTGPYWDNREFEFQLETDTPVGRNVQTALQSLFFDAHGKATM